MARKERPKAYSCPHCREQITRLPDNQAHYTCARCRARYYVMIDEETRTAAFVDQSAAPSAPPLGLPKGSIRALIALAMGGTCAALVLGGQDVPTALGSLLLTIIGFYFGFRTSVASLSDRVYDPAATREQPLFLPPGIVRTLLVLSLVGAGVLLHHRGRLLSVVTHLELFVILAGLVVGYYAGRVFRTGSAAARSAISHVKALLGLGMAAGLVWLFLTGKYQDLPDYAVMLLCATISFYFGSRT